MHLIYCYHANDPVSNTLIPLHSVRGTRTINLFGQMDHKTSLPEDLQFVDVRNNQVIYSYARTKFKLKMILR